MNATETKPGAKTNRPPCQHPGCTVKRANYCHDGIWLCAAHSNKEMGYMRLTRKIVSEIKAACRKVCGGRRKVEVGERSWPGKPDDADGYNFLLWGDGHDLFETVDIDDMTRTAILGNAGWVALDCYCYTTGDDGELDRNVYILLNPLGEILYASEDDMGHAAAINEILIENGHAGYRYAD